MKFNDVILNIPVLMNIIYKQKEEEITRNPFIFLKNSNGNNYTYLFDVW